MNVEKVVDVKKTTIPNDSSKTDTVLFNKVLDKKTFDNTLVDSDNESSHHQDGLANETQQSEPVETKNKLAIYRMASDSVVNGEFIKITGQTNLTQSPKEINTHSLLTNQKLVDPDVSQVLRAFNGILDDGTQVNVLLPVDGQQVVDDLVTIPTVSLEELIKLLEVAGDTTNGEVVDIVIKEGQITTAITSIGQSDKLLVDKQSTVNILQGTTKDGQVLEFLIASSPVPKELPETTNSQPVSESVDELPSLSLESVGRFPTQILKSPMLSDAKMSPTSVNEKEFSNNIFIEDQLNVTKQPQQFAKLSDSYILKSVSDRTAVFQFQQQNLSNLEKQLVAQHQTLADGQKSVMKLVLHPEKLGQVDIHLQMTDGKISAKLMVGSEQVKHLFEKSLPVLEQNLSKQNIQLEKVEIVQSVSQNQQLTFDFSGEFSRQQQEHRHQKFQSHATLSNGKYTESSEKAETNTVVESERIDILV
ncbi:hypothetical protein CBF34_01155 [Vagococcus penaei]|uniref:Flagellar hook-length control protein-like C-terminal domain-containing protein n=1 Tax=Vagococcus penaei TaxID=633807 RepID=A0A1Q2D882_9ENTE|nr:flagellar hook-length control protein FliK [Vagococcus penaei]AQP54567.1 hypothetical protein BW732_10380 [Vagococcus penaei]RSU06720.1 hypothetical protein CBF34_01155 [Vagococcus penaei]